MTRLLLIILFFLISLLAVFEAPAYYLWLLAIVVAEFPLVFVTISAVLVASGFWLQKHQLAGTVIGVVSVILYLSPIVRAYAVGGTLKDELNTAFSLTGGDAGQPFSFSKLFIPTKDIACKTLTYINYADTALTLNYYPSQVAGKRPCVIVVHGGSWAKGDKAQLPELNSYLARKGYNVVSIDYRMAPKYKNPAPVMDLKEALKYLRKESDKLNIDTNNFVLLGRSAGAQIALLAAYTLHDKSIKGVIDFYGPADMVWGYSLPANPWIMDSRGVMEAYLGGSYAKVPQNYAASSPIEFVDKDSPPTLIIHGHNDVLVAYEHSRRLSQKLEQNGVKHYWLKLPWATHGFDFNLNGPGGQLSTCAVERFLQAVSPQPPEGEGTANLTHYRVLTSLKRLNTAKAIRHSTQPQMPLRRSP
ncbi:alpha/beta hydrolase [Mucilaginibacter sp. UR6-11]|uniref:alpha/beta hydrolase n=1 Tax=Mucilaginibacter sp. UR6-11 TaxID=1435644 RepID=UPI001E6145B9|nr:alpha/beta hydrolase [Mucilaginibacter sp. UR6-11]MCC8424509.1 alpha/beta hydrolase [Mucilaginibacter sp. UR6-11]